MMKHNKVLSAIGLAARARKLLSGETMVEKGIQSGGVCLVIVAGDASDNTKKRFSDKCKYYKVKCVVYATKKLLGLYTGKELRAVVGITEENFADLILSKL